MRCGVEFYGTICSEVLALVCVIISKLSLVTPFKGDLASHAKLRGELYTVQVDSPGRNFNTQASSLNHILPFSYLLRIQMFTAAVHFLS